MKFAIIGGDFERLSLPCRQEIVETPYGRAEMNHVTLDDGTQFIHLNRHNLNEKKDARDCNFRANMFGLFMRDVTHVVSLSSVGTCDYTHKLGSYCLVSDFIDFTHARENSFEREHRHVIHAGMEDVFDPTLNDALERIMLEQKVPYAGRVVYAGFNGPRFETAAESRMMRMLGAQVVGMVLVPEAPLAAEIGLKYASIGIISNYSTGMTAEVTFDDISRVTNQNRDRAFAIAIDLIRTIHA